MASSDILDKIAAGDAVTVSETPADTAVNQSSTENAPTVKTLAEMTLAELQAVDFKSLPLADMIAYGGYLSKAAERQKRNDEIAAEQTKAAAIAEAFKEVQTALETSINERIETFKKNHKGANIPSFVFTYATTENKGILAVVAMNKGGRKVSSGLRKAPKSGADRKPRIKATDGVLITHISKNAAERYTTVKAGDTFSNYAELCAKLNLTNSASAIAKAGIKISKS